MAGFTRVLDVDDAIVASRTVELVDDQPMSVSSAGTCIVITALQKNGRRTRVRIEASADINLEPRSADKPKQ